LLDEVVAADFAFLGACYGIGVLGAHQGGTIDTAHPEPVGPLSVTLTDEGTADPLFAGVPTDFVAYGGHKEGLSGLPPHAVLLATSAACPVQAFRVGQNVYATQFHPELDLAGICTRIEVYKHAGYFDPDEAELLQARARAAEVSHPGTLLRNFVARHAR
ncbi:MAG: glutamine amidotransferase, partial [Marmoricola sp.]